MKKIIIRILYFGSLLLIATEQPQHWAEAELPKSAMEAIRTEDSARLIESLRTLPKAKLNAALIAACRLGKLESAKVLVNMGAEPSFSIMRHPAGVKESPLRYAIESDNLTLVAYLLPYKEALHLERGDDSLELGTAAATGRVEATTMLLDAIQRAKPNRYRQYLENAIVVMIWNKRRAAAIDIVARNLENLPGSSFESLKKAVVASGGSSSLRLLEDVWRAARETRSEKR